MSKRVTLFLSGRDADHYASAVPKPRKGQALLPVELHVFLSEKVRAQTRLLGTREININIISAFAAIISERCSSYRNSGYSVLCAVPPRNPHKHVFPICRILHVICTAISAESSLRSRVQQLSESTIFLSSEQGLFVESK